MKWLASMRARLLGGSRGSRSAPVTPAASPSVTPKTDLYFKQVGEADVLILMVNFRFQSSLSLLAKIPLGFSHVLVVWNGLALVKFEIYSRFSRLKWILAGLASQGLILRWLHVEKSRSASSQRVMLRCIVSLYVYLLFSECNTSATKHKKF